MRGEAIDTASERCRLAVAPKGGIASGPVDISVASFAYPRLDTPARAEVAAAVEAGRRRPGVFVLSTCLRTEVAVWGDEVELKGTLGELVGVGVADPVIISGQAGTEHLFRVAAGLESPIVGEAEILTQFRQAVAGTRASGGAGLFLRLLESAVAQGRQLREALEISPHATLAALAAQVVGAASQVAVIGTGTMARAVWTSLASLPAPPEVTVVARTGTQADLREVERLLPLERLGGVVTEFEAIVSATAAATRLLDDVDFDRALAQRDAPMMLVDMAMPPDFSPRPGIRYVGIDDLAALASRSGQAADLGGGVAAAAAETHRQATGHGVVGPLIASMIARADTVVVETVDRFAGRLSNPEDAPVLHQAAHTVARTLLDAPIEAVKQTEDERVAAALAQLFDGTG